MKRFLIVALFVVGCSGGATSGLTEATSAPTQAGLATEEPLATEKPADDPTDVPAGPALAIKVTKRTASVQPNDKASVTIKTTKKARCSIEVDYSSGASTASGLDPKTADADGLITWTWKVGSHTTAGAWPISISCTLGARSGTADTEFTVK